MKSSGLDKQSVHLEIKCHSGLSEPFDGALGGRFVGVETFTGKFQAWTFSQGTTCVYVCVIDNSPLIKKRNYELRVRK
jgi:hypothetical protein